MNRFFYLGWSDRIKSESVKTPSFSNLIETDSEEQRVENIWINGMQRAFLGGRDSSKYEVYSALWKPYKNRNINFRPLKVNGAKNIMTVTFYRVLCNWRSPKNAQTANIFCRKSLGLATGSRDELVPGFSHISIVWASFCAASRQIASSKQGGQYRLFKKSILLQNLRLGHPVWSILATQKHLVGAIEEVNLHQTLLCGKNHLVSK